MRIEQLTLIAEAGAVGMPRDAVARMSGSRADEESADYRVIKRHLQALRSAYPAARFVYIFRFRPETGDVIFLADSEPEGSTDISRPGDGYPELAQSSGLLRIIADGRPAFEGPLDDEFGTWVTAYATISGTGSKDILGYDVAAADWRRRLALAAAEGAGAVLLLGGAPGAWWLWRRRRAELNDEIGLVVQALEQSESAIMIVGTDRRIEYANSGLCRQIGYTADELIGRDWREFKTGETPEEMLAEMVRKVRSGEAWEGNWTNRRRDGSSYPVRGHITPVRRESGELRGFVAVFDDMTEILRREQELRTARDQAQAGERAKGQFLATMSHEVRTPLNGIVGYLQLLEDTRLTGEQRDYLATIRTSAQSLVQLASQILDHSRMEAGRLAVDLHPCDPQEVLEEALELFAVRTAEKGIGLYHHVAPTVPRRVRTDAGRLRQILLNLIGNAVKFTTQGAVRVELAVMEEDVGASLENAVVEEGEPAARVMLRVTVSDSGPGIAPEDLPKLFKPFAQLEVGAKRRHGGAGLGLVISRELAKVLGGDVVAASPPGQGAVFTATVSAEVIEHARPQRLPGRRIGLVVTSPGLRAHLVELVGSWGAVPVAVPFAEAGTADFELGLMALNETTRAHVLAAPSPESRWRRDRMVGLTSVDLPGETRRLLASRFRALVNVPLRHRDFFQLIDFTLHQPAATPADISAGEIRFGLRVLVAEDNAVNRVLLQRLLERLGCPWQAVPDGREAIEALRQANDFDVVLMDLNMPVVDGIEAVRRIRAGEAGDAVRQIWIAAVTADNEPAQQRRAEEVGVNDFVPKPVGYPEVQALLLRFLEARRQQVAVAPGS